MPLDFDITQISTYFNYAILIMIGLGALGGFMAGMFKSVYNFCVFLGLLLLGWFLSPVLTTFLMAFDISSIYPLNISGIDVTSVNAFLLSFIEQNYPQYAALMVEGTETFALVSQLIFMVVRLAVIIVWLVLMYTVFKVLFWIVYQFVKPRHRTAEGKRTKKTMGSRLGGTLVGALKSLLTVILLSIPLSGICSLTSSVVGLLPTNETGDEAPYVMLLTSDGAILRETAALEIPGFTTEQMDAVLAFMNNYRTTYAGIASGLLKVGDQPIDEYAFDEIMSFTVGENQVKLRLELQTALGVYSTLTSNIEGELTLEAVMALDEEILTEVFQDISTLKIIQVAIPVGIEIVTETDILGSQLDAVSQFVDIETLAEQLQEIDYGTELENIGAAVVDFSQLGIFGSELTGLELYMSLDAATVSSLLDSIGDLELVDIIGGVGMGYLLSNEGFISKLTELGLTTDDLVFDNVDWGDEIANLGDVYAAFQALGITTTDFALIDFEQMTDEELNAFATALFQSTILSDNNGVLVQVGLSFLPEEYKDFITATSIEADDLASLLGLGKVLLSSGVMDEGFDPLSLLSEANIEQLADYISGSQLLSSNISNIISSLLSSVQLPEGLTITIDPEFDWSGENGRTELIALFTAASKLVELGISDANFLSNLTGETIEELSTAISDSQILMGNIGNILDYFLSDTTLTGGMTIEIGTWDWTSEAGKTEFKALLGALGSILSSNLLTDPDLANLSDETIANLADKLSASVIIRNNLSNILNQMISTSSFEFEITAFDDPNAWTALEINSLLTSVRIIMSKTNFPEDLFSLTEEELNTLLSSELICDAIVSVLEEYTGPEGSLNGLLIISNVTQWKDIRDELGNITTEGELRKLFRSASILLGLAPDFDNPGSLVDPNRILNLSDGTADTNLDGVVDELDDDELGDILDSQILRDTIINKLIEFGTPDGETEPVLIVSLAADDPRWDDEIRNFIKAVKVVLGDPIDLNNISVDPNVLKDLTNDRGGVDDEVGMILQSIIITDTIIDKIIGLGEGVSTSLIINLTQEDPAWRDTETEDGEIRKLIRAIQIIFSDPASDLNNPDIDPNVILNLTDGTADTNGDLVVDELDSDEIGEIFASQIASDSMIKVLYDLGQGETPALIINLTLTDSRWYDDGATDGELRNFIRAVKVVLGDPIDLNNIDVDPNILKNLTNERGAEDDEVGTILKSIIITDTIIDKIIGLGEGVSTSLIINLTQEDPAWRDTEIEDGEIRKLIRAIQIIFSDPASDLNNPDIDPNVILNLTDGTVDTNGDLVVDEQDSDEIGEIFASQIASDSMIKVLYDLGQGDAPALVINLTLTDVRWYDDGTTDGELRNFIRAVKVVLGDPIDLNNINVDPNILKELTNDRGEADDEVGTILKSIIITDTIIKEIVGLGGDTSSLVINLTQEDARWRDTETEDGEIRKLIRAIQIIFSDPASDLNNPDIDPNVILNLTDGTVDTNGDFVVDELDSDEIGEIFASVIASDSMIKVLYDLGQGDAPSLVINLTLTDVRWYDDGTTEGELRHFIRAIKVILGDSPDLNNVNVDANVLKTLTLGEIDPADDDVKTIQTSIIARDTIIDKIIDIANPTVGTASLIVNLAAADEAWLDQFVGETRTDGEIRKLIKAIQIIFQEPTDDINNPNIDANLVLELTNGTEDTNGDLVVDELDSDELGEILRSQIISDSIIKQLRDLGAGENPTLIVDLAADDPRWNNSETGDGEIRNLVIAVGIVLVEDLEGNIDLNNPTIKPQADIMRLPDADITTLLRSIILSKTIVKEVIANATLTIPVELQSRDAAAWYDEGETHGELHNLISVASILMDDGATTFSSSKFLNMTEAQIDTVLASLIAKETIKNELRGMSAIIIDEANPLFVWDDTFIGENRTDGELRKLLVSATLLVENEEINIDKILTLTNAELDQLVQSRIIVDSAVSELTNMTSLTGSLYQVLYLPENPAPDYYLGSNGELKRFFIALQYLKNGNTTPEQGVGDMTTISLASLTDEHQPEILASDIVMNTIIVNIQNEATTGTTLKLPAKFTEGDPLYDENAWDVEIPNILAAMEVFLGTNADLAAMNISADNFTNLTDGTVDTNGDLVVDENDSDEIGTIVASEIIAYTIVQEIETEASRVDPVIIIPVTLAEEDWYGDQGELRKFLMAISALTTTGLQVDAAKFLNLTDPEISRVVGSAVLSNSIVKKIEAQRNDPASLITLPDKFNPDSGTYEESLWHGETGELAKTLKALRNLGMTDYTADISIRPLFDEANDVIPEVILASEVVEATIINKIEVEAGVGGSLNGSLVIPNDITWERTLVLEVETDEGELRRFLKAIDIILDGGELETAAFDVEKFFDDVEQPILLGSRIIEASVVNKIEVEQATGSLQGQLFYPSDWVQSDWYGPSGELVDFLASIEIVLNGGAFASATFEVDKFLGPDRATLLTSRVIEASVVEYVIDSTNPVDGVLRNSLYLPSGLETNNPEWYTLSGNEINRFLDAINIIIGPAGTYANANFSVDTILGPEQATLLDSRVVEASAVRYVIESAAVGGSMHDTLIIPVDLQTNGVLWYGATGELVKFLDSIEIIIGPAGTYTAAQFDVDTILGPDQETLLESRVTEASVINQIKLSTNLIFPDKTVPADVIKYYYLSNEDIVWERTYTDEVVTNIGELRRFLAGVSAINTATGGDFATLVFDMNTLMSVNFTTVLESRVLEATVADMVDDMLTSSLNGFIKTPNDGFQWFYHATSTDVTSGEVRRGEYILVDDVVDTLQYSDLLGFLNSIQQMDAAGLDFENITYQNIAACDSTALSTALWDYSRVMRGSIATMLNKTLESIPDPFHIKPTFTDEQFTSKQDVKDALDAFKAYVALL